MTHINGTNLETANLELKKVVNTNNNVENNEPILKFQNGVCINPPQNGIEINTTDDAIAYATKLVDLDINSPLYESFKNDVKNKYNNMVNVVKMTGQKLDHNIIQIRLNNYVRGWMFNQFEQNAAKDYKNSNNWVYERPTNVSDQKALEALKDNYNNLADGYVEFYDGDENGRINIIEMFYQELTEHYINIGMSQDKAKLKATEMAEKFSKISFVEIDKSNDNSDEMTLYKLLITKFGTLDAAKETTYESFLNLDKSEIQAFLFTKAQFDNTGSNTITPLESQAIEYDIMTGGSKTPNWLMAARDFLGL